MSRAAIVELLHAGWSDLAIARHVHVHTSRVRAVRTNLGLPKHRPGPTPAASLEDAFWRRAQPTDDGHLIWPGSDAVKAGPVKDRPARVAFRLGNGGREPIGNVTAGGCGQAGCVHPRHVEDHQQRETYRAIFGAAT